MIFQVLWSLVALLLGICLTVDAGTFIEPVDIVYLWVDGSDPAWREIRERYSPVDQGEIKPDANDEKRFCDHDELKYSLRSIWKFASFVNHIFIVTMNQRPSWLLDHPKITLVDHTEIFENQDHLPSFNSMAIESHLHQIPNLSCHFIYFNDDMFLGNSVDPDDFFTSTGKVKVMFERNAIAPSGAPRENEVTFLSACRNTSQLLNSHYKKEARKLVCHAPYALIKPYMEETAERFPFVFEQTSSHRFRCSEDYTITNGLFQYDWIYQGDVVRGSLKNKMILLFDDKKMTLSINQLNSLRRSRPHTFCLQDMTSEKNGKLKEVLQKFLEDWYPDAAPWEK